MDRLNQIKDLYNKYIKIYPESMAELKRLNTQLTQGDPIIASRSNFTGHATASAFIVNPETRQILLLHHRGLGKLLQPGGHIDESDTSPINAALRETFEETGVSPDRLRLVTPSDKHPETPLHIDSHHIPANRKKREPEHYHHDFRYLFTTDELDIDIDATESIGFEWVDWSIFKNLDDHKSVAARISLLINDL